MKYLQKAGFILIIFGAIFAVYELLNGEGNSSFTKSTGFYIFIIGLVLSGISVMFNRKGKTDKK